jgi:hypothetical protein
VQSSSRGNAKVVWLAVHTTEGIMRAADLLAWTSWPGSSHASSDETGALLTPDDGFVPYDRSAWTLLNGNPISENIEQCGWAAWTREEWLSRPLLLDATARWLAERSNARGIPLVHLTLDEVRARKPGVLGHCDYTRAVEGTHTDPGPNYPWDVVLDKARAYASGINPEEFTVSQYDDIMAAIKQVRDEAWQQHKDMANFNGVIVGNVARILVGNHTDGDDRLTDLWNAIRAIAPAGVDMDALKAAMSSVGPVDVDALAKKLADEADRRARDGNPATGPVS